ncbi:hypothetical protein EWU23_13595 [Cytophagaceae bacterium 50C-KIRBA]|uniref:Uncharacterized protein n=1 Tax=Aquirufa beregesia TaxID=2516556 RepID=A0ABX0EZQ6_9BACT|nr:hypothetical protein [Aquirufa beregesia]
MKRDKIYEDLHFSSDFSVEDWNALVKLKLGKYFSEESALEKNKEILRTEINTVLNVFDFRKTT